MAKQLTERRAADRAEMSEKIRALAIECGAEAETVDRPHWDMSPREIVVRIKAARGLCLNVDFDGDSPQPDTHVLSWHMATGSTAKLYPHAFQSVNSVHFHKATDIAEGFDQLVSVLRRRLTAAAKGSLFQPEYEGENGPDAATVRQLWFGVRMHERAGRYHLTAGAVCIPIGEGDTPLDAWKAAADLTRVELAKREAAKTHA